MKCGICENTAQFVTDNSKLMHRYLCEVCADGSSEYVKLKGSYYDFSKNK